jgi:hypothetical protein
MKGRIDVNARASFLLAILLGAGVAIAAAGCTTGAPEGPSGDWAGTITTEDDITTVVTTSGSLWDGTATLVEEMSIGVDAGADEYMFGTINSIYATDDRIYVADVQVPAVRVYDHDGAFIMNLGRSGQGPGEYEYPAFVTADSTGRAFVLASRLARINVYAPTGEPLEQWPMPSSGCCAWPMYPLTDEAVWAPVVEWLEGRPDRRYGVQAIGPSGPYGEVTWVPDLEYEETTYPVIEDFEAKTPFSAWLAWNPAPDGRLLVGASDRYRFEVHGRDGSTLVVERYWEPEPVPAAHREWERRFAVAFQRRGNAPAFTWDGAEIPHHKPAYGSLIPGLSGETWVVRAGASERLPDCVEDPIAAGHQAAYDKRCWTEQRIVDAFAADGRYLGEVEAPEGLWSPGRMIIDGRRVIAIVQDAEGTLMVKRYRLVLPG